MVKYRWSWIFEWENRSVDDTMGLSNLLPDYVVETVFKKIDDQTTQVEISHFYSSSKLKVWLLNFFIKRKVGKETQDTLNAIKKIIENEH